MILSAEQFSAIVAFLRPQEEAPRGGNHRWARRISFQAELCISLWPRDATMVSNPQDCADGGGAPGGLTVQMRNISRRGVAFLSPTRLDRGQQIVVHLSSGKGQPIDIVCTVAHCRAQGVFYTVGAGFEGMADAEDDTNDAEDAADVPSAVAARS